jgi:hypothetical protein
MDEIVLGLKIRDGQQVSFGNLDYLDGDRIGSGPRNAP